ncbi:MAG: PilZ domain-containing protein, partial [Myxococcota bacterium]
MSEGAEDSRDPGRERRRHPRIASINLVNIGQVNEEGMATGLSVGRTLDLTEFGVRLELDHALPLRSVLSVTLALEDDVVELQGRVVFVQEIDAVKCRMG